MSTSVCSRWPAVGSLMGLVGGLALVLAACSSGARADREVVRVVGSDTMLHLNGRLAVGFMRIHPGVAVEVLGGGTGVGVQRLVEGTTDVCAASRPLSSEEVRLIHLHHETLGVRYLVALDALSVYVNEENPVQDLSVEALRGLFSGATRWWSRVGGPKERVMLVSRPPASGTHHFFRQRVLEGGSYAPGALVVQRTDQVVEAVRQHQWAIGYGGFAYASGVVRCRIEGVEPVEENVRDQRYPLTRYLQYYTVRPPSGWVKAFVEWTLGPEGQAIVEEAGYFSLWKGAGLGSGSG